MGLLDFIFPKYCVNCKKLGLHLCSDCFSYLSFDVNNICLVCGRQSINSLTHPFCRTRYTIDGAFSALNYKGPVKKLIYQFKYKPYLTDLKTILCDLLYEALIQKEEFNEIFQGSSDLIFVPIPLYKSKQRGRGYNQAEILAGELRKRLDPSRSLRMTMINILERTRNTKSQVGLKKEERRKNIKGAFEISKRLNLGQGSTLKQASILLVDDVLTTGSTLLEAASVLKRNGVKKVYGLTLAKD
ncbi:MAG: ComF family protein [Candidatus Levybacteria bacterium]|nr:ComF family protein [Candidatus Levybacteria bacterium]